MKTDEIRAEFEQHILQLVEAGELHANAWPLFERSPDNPDSYLDLYLSHRWNSWKAAKTNSWMTRDELSTILSQEFPLRSSMRFRFMSAEYIVDYFLNGKIEHAANLTRIIKEYVAEMRGEASRCTNCGTVMKGGLCQNYGCE